MQRVTQHHPVNLPVPARVAGLSPYVPGSQPQGSGWIKLNTNESPYPPSPQVAAAIRAELGDDGSRLRLYPSPASDGLRAAIARLHKLQPSQVIAGNGSDDILNLLIRAFTEGTAGAVIPVPAYSLYPVLLNIQGSTCSEIPFERDMRLPVERIAESTAPICFLTSPNAPTGVGFTPAEIEAVLTNYRGILIVDEAYAPFADSTALSLLERYPQLVITRTLSKAYGLAGLRVGYALASAEIIGLLDRVRDSYNLDRLAQAGAIAALEDHAYTDRVIARIKATRQWTADFLATQGWFTYPSQANFLFTEPKRGGKAGAEVAASLFQALNEAKILVRYFPNHPLTCSFLRISVGTQEEMTALTEAISAWQQNG